MTSKLTLTVDRLVMDKAKSYAQAKGKTLSDLLENYLEAISKEVPSSSLSPKLKRLVGSVQLPADFNDETELRSAFENKHLK
jgi:Family of unknown function (DUF6364)